MTVPPEQVLSADELVVAVGLYLTKQGRWPEGYSGTISFAALPEGERVLFSARVVWQKEPAK